MLYIRQRDSGPRLIENGVGRIFLQELLVPQDCLLVGDEIISRSEAAELIPILQAFVDTGRLPEPEKGGES